MLNVKNLNYLIGQIAESLVFNDSLFTKKEKDLTYGFGRYVKTFGSSVNIDDCINIRLQIAEKEDTDTEACDK